MNQQQTWTAESIPDQSGRVAIVTGSSSGIGFEAARQLARKGADVIIAVRNAEKGERALHQILEQHPNAKAQVMLVDLANLDSVRAFAEEFRARYDHLDMLINNAGVMMPPHSKTADGFELQMGTNHLGHFALTGLLLDRLQGTPGSSIVNVSSSAHNSGELDFADLQWETRPYRAMKAYGDSKLANIYFTFELAGRLTEAGAEYPKVTSAHPGWTATDLQRHSGIFGFLNPFFAQSIEMGALPTLRAALDESAESGTYFGPQGFMTMRGYPGAQKTSDRSHDTDSARKLWDVSEKLTGVRFEIREAAKA